MARILIDGYNFLYASDFRDRDDMLDALSRYQTEGRHAITVVFDGTHQGTGTGTHEFRGGVEVVFSPLTISADDLIEELVVKKRGEELIVVSSDRRIETAARRAQCIPLSSQEFRRRLTKKMRTASSRNAPPWMEGREAEFENQPSQGKSRRKKSKRERKKDKRLRGL